MKFKNMTDEEMYAHDEQIFRNILGLKNRTVVVLNNGLGDHIVVKRIIEKLNNPLVYSCYPEVIPGRSIEEAFRTFGSLDEWDIYRKMDQWKWTGSLSSAFARMYGVTL